jgi:hypothetical protein
VHHTVMAHSHGSRALSGSRGLAAVGRRRHARTHRVSSLRCGPGRPSLWRRSEVCLCFELVVAAAVDLDPRRQVVQLVEFGLAEGDVGRCEVLL